VTLGPVQTRSLPDEVFGQLLAEIVSGRYAPGATLSGERGLSDVFGVNRHVVREALKRLEQVGLVKTVHGGGTKVLEFRRTAGLDLLAVIAEHPEAMEGLLVLLRSALEMRAVIGVDVARLCAKNANDEVRDELVETSETLAAVARGSELLPLDQRFWQLMLDGAGNIAYQLAFNSLIRAVHATPDFSVRWLERELESCDYRRGIARAVAALDAAAAETAARDALAPAAEMLVAAVQTPNATVSSRQ
jgi:GntR family transcriptional regulator, transcriptional repressor for pyruvate dehydrogenase complex